MRREVLIGEEVNWVPFSPGVAQILSEKKPGMFVIMKSYSFFSRQLGYAFQIDSELISLSKQFVMIAMIDGEEPKFHGLRPGMP